MTAANHISGGVVFTGVCSSLVGVNMLSDWRLIVLTVFCSLLPDVDTTQSLLGRMVKPISSKIYDAYGHRTATHSIFFHLAATALAALISSGAAVIVFFSILSHIILDMITVSGVFYLYPRKIRFVLPANQAYRFRSSDKRSEAVFFAISILMFWFLQPLMEQGFWTTYNKQFATVAHLASEFEKSEKMLEVQAVLRNGSKKIEVSGLVYAADDSGFDVVQDGRTRHVPGKFEIVEEIEFRRTEIEFWFEYDCLGGIQLGENVCLKMK